jgi:hypothetical protein
MRNLWILGLLALGVYTACSSSDSKAPPSQIWNGEGGTAGSHAGGTAGKAGAKQDAGKDTGSDSDPDSDSDGAAGTAGSGEDADTDTGPVLSCTTDIAFAAKSLTYSSPTPDALIPRLGELIYDKATPFVLVVHNDSGTMYGAISATQDAGGMQVFPLTETPCLQLLVTQDWNVFTTQGPVHYEADPQPLAYLHLTDTLGPVSIKLEHVRWVATTTAQCSDMLVDVQAYIPDSELSLVLHFTNGDHTLGEYYSGGMKNPFHFVFQGELKTFDYTTLTLDAGCTGAGGSGGSDPDSGPIPLDGG